MYRLNRTSGLYHHGNLVPELTVNYPPSRLGSFTSVAEPNIPGIVETWCPLRLGAPTEP